MYSQLGRWKRFRISLPKNGPNLLSGLPPLAALVVPEAKLGFRGTKVVG